MTNVTTETIRIDCPSSAHEKTYYIEVEGSTRQERIDAACDALKEYLDQSRLPRGYTVLDPGTMDGFDSEYVYTGANTIPPTPEPEPTPEPTPEPVAEPKPNKANALVQAIADIAGEAVNEERVIALIKEHSPKTPAREVIVKSVNREPVTIDGLVHEAFDELLQVASAGLNVMMVGPAGTGKSILAESVAKALDKPFTKTGSVMLPSDVMGYVDASGQYHATPCRAAFEDNGLHLFDEMDSYSPRALMAAQSLLDSSDTIFWPDTPRGASKGDTLYMASANTFGKGADRTYTGRAQLDAATLNRLYILPVGYDRAIEKALAGEHTDWLERVWRVRKACEEKGYRHIVSTRQVVNGRQLLEIGMPFELVEKRLLRRDLDDTTWNAIK